MGTFGMDAQSAKWPKTNTEFWRDKIVTDVKKGRKITSELRKAG